MEDSLVVLAHSRSTLRPTKKRRVSAMQRKKKILPSELFTAESGLRFHCIVPTRASNIDEWRSWEVTSAYSRAAAALHHPAAPTGNDGTDFLGSNLDSLLQNGGVDSQWGGIRRVCNSCCLIKYAEAQNAPPPRHEAVIETVDGVISCLLGETKPGGGGASQRLNQRQYLWPVFYFKEI